MHHKKAPCHYQHYSQPLRPHDMFVEDEHRRYHTEHVCDTGERVGNGEGVVFQDIHPQHSCRRETDAAAQPPPVGELVLYERPRERYLSHSPQCQLHLYLSGTQAEALYQYQAQ